MWDFFRKICALAILVCAAISDFQLRAADLRIVKDTTGNTVRIKSYPSNILSLCTSATDTIIRLGEKRRIAGIDEYSRIVPDTQDIPVLGKGSSISREQLLFRKIDLAFIWWYQEDVSRLLSELNIPVVRLQCKRASQLPELIRLIGDCIGSTNSAERLADTVARQLKEIAGATNGNRISVYFELYSPFKTSGRDTYLNDIIELAGGKNIANSASGSILLSAEHLLKEEPDCIILLEGFCAPSDFARRAGINSLKAVQNRRIYSVSPRLTYPSAGIVDGINEIRTILNKTLTNK